MIGSYLNSAAELLGLDHTIIYIKDMVAPNNEAATNVSKAGNSSARATITITMYAGDGE